MLKKLQGGQRCSKPGRYFSEISLEQTEMVSSTSMKELVYKGVSDARKLESRSQKPIVNRPTRADDSPPSVGSLKTVCALTRASKVIHFCYIYGYEQNTSQCFSHKRVGGIARTPRKARSSAASDKSARTYRSSD